MSFVPKSSIPIDKIITYARIVCDYRPFKSEPNRTRLTVGGDRLQCLHDTSPDAADLILIKLFFNSILSTKDAKFTSADIIDFSWLTIHYLVQNSCEFMKSLFPWRL